MCRSLVPFWDLKIALREAVACLESSGTFVWSSNLQCAQDPRIAVHVTPDSLEWELAISSASPGDSGLYECQVTAPKDNRIGHEILTLKFSFNYV